MCVTKGENLMRLSQHIDKMMHAQTKEEKEKICLHFKTLIISAWWLAIQGCAFGGHDESSFSSNRGNFLELVKVFAKINTKIDKVVFENALKMPNTFLQKFKKRFCTLWPIEYDR